MITIQKNPGQRILELGGGDNPHPQSDCRVDVRQGPRTHFAADFNEPLPIQSDEWDGVLAIFVLEHISWRKVPQFLSEMCRVTKPGGKVIVVTSNTEEQLKWIQAHRDGWDGKSAFESMSCVLYGDQDYAENSHRSYFSPAILFELFEQAGFRDILIEPYGERATDLAITASKARLGTPAEVEQRIIHGDPDAPKPGGVIHAQGGDVQTETPEAKEMARRMAESAEFRQEVFDKAYFNGGAKYGGYSREGLWDFPVHNITARHVLERKPESVLELGAARGYVLKRIQDAGVVAAGMEISKHCWMTRVCEAIELDDICKTPWVVPDHHTQVRKDIEYDLCFSIAVLEHLPEQHLPAIIKEMARTCKRGLHGVDFGERDDAWDKTHVTLRNKSFWDRMFAEHAPGWPVEIVDKESLEVGPPEWQRDWLEGDGRLKLNVGSFTTQFHHGWENLDIHDLKGFAQHYGYRFRQCDIRNGLPYGTGVVDAIYSSHTLEHLTAKEGLSFLKECRRVIRPDGAMRIIVPDARLLNLLYSAEDQDVQGVGDVRLSDFDEINEGCAASPTAAGKLWSLLHENHFSCYDAETLCHALKEAGWIPYVSPFRGTGMPSPVRPMAEQILRESLDVLPCLSLFVTAVPLVG